MSAERNHLQPLTRATLRKAVVILCQDDALLQELYEKFGPPPLWQRTQSFKTLVHIVMEQKISLASARAVMLRIQSLCPSMSAAQFLDVPERVLREAGSSERKISYCRSIAQAITRGDLDLTALRSLGDQDVIEQLTAIRGIGPWTAGVYLLMAMRRPDAWASGDRALVVSLAESASLEVTPSYAEFDEIAERWKPRRAAAARLLWHAYLSRRR